MYLIKELILCRTPPEFKPSTPKMLKSLSEIAPQVLAGWTANKRKMPLASWLRKRVFFSLNGFNVFSLSVAKIKEITSW
jgi:hypothetical protein